MDDNNMTVTAATRILQSEYGITFSSYGLRTHIVGGSKKLVQPVLAAVYESNPAVPKGYYLITRAALNDFAGAYLIARKTNTKLGMRNAKGFTQS